MIFTSQIHAGVQGLTDSGGINKSNKNCRVFTEFLRDLEVHHVL